MARLALGLLALAAFASGARAQCEIDRLVPTPTYNWLSDGEFAGDLLVLAGDGDRFTVFERALAGWLQTASVHVPATFTLESPRVAVAGDLVAVGMAEDGPGPNDVYGGVYLYDRTAGWSSHTLVTPGSPAKGDAFGRALDLAGDTLVVGAPQRVLFFGDGPGRCHVFEFDGAAWNEVAVFHPHDYGPESFSYYACNLQSISTDGRTIAVGASGDSQAGPYAGAVYVYERDVSGWHEVAKLTCRPQIDQWAFGRAVAVQGTTLAITDYERVHVYERAATGWVPRQTLLSPAPGSFDGFANSLALEGDTLVIGAPGADTPQTNVQVGALHVYRRKAGLWEPDSVVLAEDAAAYAYFGSRANLDGGNALWIGADPEGRLFDTGIDRAANYCPAAPNSTGVAAALGAGGCDSLLADRLAFVLQQAPAGELAWLRVATAPDQTPFGNGLLCLGGTTSLLAAGATSAAGTWGVELDLTAPPFAAWTPGVTAYFQAGFRDDAFGAGHGTSDALALELQP